MDDYERWLEDNEDELTIAWAESGADREACFNASDRLDDAYNEYCNGTPCG